MSILTSIASRVIEETVSKMTPGLYSRDCVNSGIDAFVGFKRQEIIETLALKSIQPDGLKSSIRHALLKDSLTKVDISNIATIISSTSLRELFTKWIGSNPEVVKNIRTRDGISLGQKILNDISQQALRNSESFQEWLSGLPKKSSESVSKSGGFKSGGIYFTAFGVFFPGNKVPILFAGMTLPVTTKPLYEYSGDIFGGEGIGVIFQITKTDIRQNVSNRFYNQNGTEIVFKDQKSVPYKVISIANNGVIRAREMTNGIPSKNLKEYTIHSVKDGTFILQDNTSRVPSGRVPRSEPAGSSAPEEENPPQE